MLVKLTIKEFFMHSLGVPLSKKYFRNLFSAQLERMKMVYKTTTSFNELPCKIQDDIIQANSFLGIAMVVARSENFSTGYEQVISSTVQLFPT